MSLSLETGELNVWCFVGKYEKCLLCLSTSFWVLRAPKSWLKHLFGVIMSQRCKYVYIEHYIKPLHWRNKSALFNLSKLTIILSKVGRRWKWSDKIRSQKLWMHKQDSSLGPTYQWKFDQPLYQLNNCFWYFIFSLQLLHLHIWVFLQVLE